MLRALLLTIVLLPITQFAQAQLMLREASDLPGRYILQFVSSVDVPAQLRGNKSAAVVSLKLQQQQRVSRLLADLAATDLKIIRNLWLKQALAVSVSSEFLPRIRALSYVAEVSPERQYRAESLSIVTLPLSGEVVQDNLDKIDVDPPWSDQYRGQGVVVAIVDSGIDPFHDDLATRWRGGTNSWFDPYGEQGSPKDATGHGTAVASIVLGGNASASYLGVAPNAQWIGGRIFDNFGRSEESAISATLQWLLDPDNNPATDDYPDIVQNSWGLAASEGSCVNPFTAELAAIDAFGIDLVFAVGNSGMSGPGPGGFSSYLTPSFDAHVISVGAIRDDDNLLFASSRGPDLCGSAIIPSLVAPGNLIKTAELTFNGFDPDNTAINSGTSYSSPHVSGALALLRSKFNAADHLQYRNALFNTTTNLGAQDDFGRGLIQVAAAITWMENQSIPQRVNEVNFSMADYLFLETDADAKIALIRSGDLTTAASVDISSSDGSATGLGDYQPIATTVNFDPGESVKTIDIPLIDDTTGEDIEYFNLTLSQNINVNLGARSTLTVRIQDDDNPSDEDEIGGSSIGIFELIMLGLWCLGRRRLV
ncbi:MAG: S8 family serine peptidase [Gammaproteobacteria bacterium]|nr:S8 family serine peptidase [Gammaproteobacteria bacterium]